MKKDKYIILSAALLAIIPTLLLSLIISYMLSQSMYTNRMEDLQSTSNTIANYINQAYSSGIDGADNEKQFPAYSAFLNNTADSNLKAEAQKTIETATAANSSIQSSSLVDTSGNIVVASNTAKIGKNIADTELFKHVSASSDSFCELTFQDNVPVMIIGMRIMDGDRFIGIYRRSVSLPLVQSIADNENSNNGAVFLIGNNNQSIDYLPGTINRRAPSIPANPPTAIQNWQT